MITGKRDLEEQLSTADKMDLESGIRELLERSARFHGHVCPGLAIGINASDMVLNRWRRAIDEELVAVVENDACCVDAIQELLGCTFGKGNLIFRDHGKMVFTFYRRGEEKGIRLSLKPVERDEDPGEASLVSRIRSGEASEGDRLKYRELWVKRAVEVLKRGNSIFDIREVKDRPPERARIHGNSICSSCGEPVSKHRIVTKDDRPLCIPCSGEI